MLQVVGVRLKRAGRVHYFQVGDGAWAVGEIVVVETERGLELGRVVLTPREMAEEGWKELPRPILRRATPEDQEQARLLAGKAGEALEKARTQVVSAGLTMKLLSAEYNLDGNRLTIYFSAEGRVDFRNLVRDLAALFQTRIELRQVGPRDETKLMGGVGECGLGLCCACWLTEFAPVSIKMAKEQELSLNPMKISGICGRLLCCLAYEMEQYIELKRKLPPNGQRVTTPLGVAVVVGGNPIKETALVELESQAVVEVPVSQLTPIHEA